MAIFSFLLSLGCLNIVYAGGKLLFALRWSIHHKHYFIGVGPKLFTLSFRGIKYSIGFYIPIIGLARIYDYTSGTKQRAQSAWEFREQPLWKRLTTALAGTVSLAIAGVLIFIGLAYHQEESFISREEVNKHGIYPSALAAEAGFKRGDKVLLINGEVYDSHEDLLSPQKKARYTILRDGKQQDIVLSESLDNLSNEVNSYPFLSVLAPFKVGDVLPNSVAERGGIQVGDQITAINDAAIFGYEDFRDALTNDEDGMIDLKVKRESDKEILLSSLSLDSNRKLGFIPEVTLQYSTKQNTLAESAVKGISYSWHILSSNLRAAYWVFSGNESTSSKSVKGPIGITDIYGGGFQWERLWTITAMFAIWGAFLSVLPLPHTTFWEVLPLGYEASTEKVFSYELYRKIKRLGYFLIIAIMVWVMIGDLLMVLI